MFIAAAMIMSLAMVMPAQAQSRKEKKLLPRLTGNWSKLNSVKKPFFVIR